MMEKCRVQVFFFRHFWEWRLLTSSVDSMGLWLEMLSTRLVTAHAETLTEIVHCFCSEADFPGCWRERIAVYSAVVGTPSVSQLLWD